MRSKAVALCLLVLAFPSLLEAAEPKTAPPKPMQVVIAQSTEPGCQPNCPEWISAQGAIDETTPRQFRRILAKLGNRKLPVLVNSFGGRVEPAMEVGRMIRAKGLDVFVTKTALKPCAPADSGCALLKRRDIHAGLPEARMSVCASSCAFILAGGAHRHVGAMTLVGLHQITSYRVLTQVLQRYRIVTSYQSGVPVAKKSLISEKMLSQSKQTTATPQASYDKIKSYFAEMGVAESVMPILMSTPSSSIRWLRRHELTATGLATDFDTGEQALLRAKLEAPPPAAPSPAATFTLPGVPSTPAAAPLLPPAPGPSATAAVPAAPPAAPAASKDTPVAAAPPAAEPGQAQAAPVQPQAPATPKPKKTAAAPAAKPSPKPQSGAPPNPFARESR